MLGQHQAPMGQLRASASSSPEINPTNSTGWREFLKRCGDRPGFRRDVVLDFRILLGTGSAYIAMLNSRELMSHENINPDL
jgi:hypothetical protein